MKRSHWQWLRSLSQRAGFLFASGPLWNHRSPEKIIMCINYFPMWLARKIYAGWRLPSRRHKALWLHGWPNADWDIAQSTVIYIVSWKKLSEFSQSLLVLMWFFSWFIPLPGTIHYIHTLNFWYGTDKIDTGTKLNWAECKRALTACF
jgi:hypothetical protein